MRRNKWNYNKKIKSEIYCEDILIEKMCNTLKALLKILI